MRSSRSSSDGPAPAGRPSHLLVGTLGKPHGLRGELHLTVHSDDPTRFSAGAAVRTSGGRDLVVRGLRAVTTRRGERSLISFEGVDDRTGAETLVGADLVVAVQDVRTLGDGEWWDHDLVGCTVVTVNGDHVGRVRDVLHLPANEVLEVEVTGGEVLVPLVADLVLRIDPDERVIVVDPIPGLLDPG